MPPMMTGSGFGACLRISASSAAMSDRRLSSTAAMYSAGVFTFSCPFIFIASSENSALPDRQRPRTGASSGVLPYLVLCARQLLDHALAGPLPLLQEDQA